MTKFVGLEGHRTLATMKPWGVDTEKGVVRYSSDRITAKDDGSEWYLITDSGDPRCPSQVSGRGIKAEVNDFRYVEPLRVSQYEYNVAEAKEGCLKLGSTPGEGACDDHFSMLRQQYDKHGRWLAFQGIMESRNGGENIMNITVNAETGEYGDLSRHPIGTTEVIGWGKDFELDPDVIRMLDQRRIIAQGPNAPQVALR